VSARAVDLARDRRAWYLAIPLALVVVCAFWPALDSGFVNWDDDKNFIQNPYFQGLGLAHLYWAWTAFWVGVYQPFAWMLLEVQYAIWNLTPWGYHLVSLFLHAVNSVVLYALVLTLLARALPELCEEHPTRAFVSAGIASALFAVHPLRTEVVAWASSQPYLPCAFFYFMALLFYVRAFPADRASVRRWFWISLLFFAGALLSKAVAVSLPFTLLLLDYYPLRRIGWGADRRFRSTPAAVWFEKIPFFLLSALFMLLAWAARPHDALVPVTNPDGFWLVRLVRPAYGIWFYLGKTVWPFTLTAFYSLPKGTSPLELRFVTSLAGFIVVTVAAFRLRRSHPALLVGWLSYCVILLPNLGIVSARGQLAADRYSYVAMVGPVSLVAGLLCANRLWSRAKIARSFALGATVAWLIGALIVLTRIQCRTWQSSEALWTHALNHGGERVPEVQNSLGLSLMSLGRTEDARQHFLAAIGLEPGFGDAHNNLGSLFWRLGEFSEAKAQFVEAIRLKPEVASAHRNLGSSFVREGNIGSGIREYVEAVRLDPDGDGVAQLDDLLVIRRSAVTPRLIPLLRAVIANPRDQTALQALEDGLMKGDK